jgi:hypothetical protein
MNLLWASGMMIELVILGLLDRCAGGRVGGCGGAVRLLRSCSSFAVTISKNESHHHTISITVLQTSDCCVTLRYVALRCTALFWIALDCFGLLCFVLIGGSE